MKRTFFALLALCLLLSGCGGGTQTPDASQMAGEEASITFTDDLGREVTAQRPERVAALIGSFADVWCVAGGKDTLVAAANDAWTSFDLDLGEDVANLGTTKEPNLEILLAAQPDLILASVNTSADVELLDTLEGAGLNVAYFQVSTFQDYLEMLDICTQLTGKTENYQQYGLALQAQIQQAKDRADGTEPTVLYVRASGSSCKVKNSKDSVLGEMLADLDCRNIADREESLLEELSLEVILAEDPTFIFLILQGSDQTAAQQVLDETLLSNPAWQSLSAVQEGRCYVLDDKLYNLKPNAKWGEAYEKLAEILYPDGGQ